MHYWNSACVQYCHAHVLQCRHFTTSLFWGMVYPCAAAIAGCGYVAADDGDVLGQRMLISPSTLASTHDVALFLKCMTCMHVETGSGSLQQ